MSRGTPDFDDLALRSYWSPEDWRYAWDALAIEDDRDELWPAIVNLGPYTSPRKAVHAVMQALHIGSPAGFGTQP